MDLPLVVAARLRAEPSRRTRTRRLGEDVRENKAITSKRAGRPLLHIGIISTICKKHTNTETLNLDTDTVVEP